MHKIDSSTSVLSMPTPSSVGPGTPGWFAHGVPSSVPYTVLTSDWANAVQSELVNVITAAGISLDKSDTSQLLAAMQTLNRIKLSNNVNLYVSTTGDDSNDGLTSGTPFLTLQKAVNYAAKTYDTQGWGIFIYLADGTYTVGASCGTPLVGGGSYQFVGNTGSPSSCVINLASAGTAIGASFGANVGVRGIKIAASVGSSSIGAVPGVCLGASLGGIVSIQGAMEFGGTQRSHMECGQGGSIFINHGYTISGNASVHWVAGTSTLIAGVNQTITLTGTPAFSLAFAWAANGQVYCPGFVFSGSATGSRYILDSGGMIDTNGGGASFLPGNSPGTGSIADGGYYT